MAIVSRARSCSGGQNENAARQVGAEEGAGVADFFDGDVGYCEGGEVRRQPQ